jgi:hypothetical protein
MTIEGRPELNVDWQAEYQKQRRSRMDDCINDYMGDEEIDPRFCYEDMLSICDEWIKYHKKHITRWTELKSLMMGHRAMDPIFLTEDRDSNFPGENTVVKLGEDPVIFGT